MKELKIYLISFIAILCGMAAMLLYALFTPVVTQEGGVAYYLRHGTSKRLAIAQLNEQGIISRPIFLYIYALPQRNAALKSGEYLFPQGATPYSIWHQLTTGTGLFYRHFTIVPGWTFTQLRNELAKVDGLKHITAAFDAEKIMHLLAASTESPEGQFFPETYNYTKDSQDITVLKRAYDFMQLKLNDAWAERDTSIPYKNPYEALIAASMIEKEGYLDAERPLISSVIVNRLKKNMLLQIDATVIFGLGARYTGKIYKSDLIEDTPFNTYLHKGLPPSPIAMPGLSSIQAALHPQKSDFYYYVARGDGRHQFSTTLNQHSVAVQAAATEQNNSAGSANETLLRRHMDMMLSPLLMH